MELTQGDALDCGSFDPLGLKSGQKDGYGII
jgi:hypothetical protein